MSASEPAPARRDGAPRPLAFVADDDGAFRAVLRRELGALGYDVVEAADGEQALEALALAADGDAPIPDVIVLDVCMPGYSGLGILRALQRFGDPPPTFLVTGFDDRSVDVLGRNLGAIRVFHKPVDLDEVLGAIARAGGTAGQGRGFAQRPPSLPRA